MLNNSSLNILSPLLNIPFLLKIIKCFRHLSRAWQTGKRGRWTPGYVKIYRVLWDKDSSEETAKSQSRNKRWKGERQDWGWRALGIDPKQGVWSPRSTRINGWGQVEHVLPRCPPWNLFKRNCAWLEWKPRPRGCKCGLIPLSETAESLSLLLRKWGEGGLECVGGSLRGSGCLRLHDRIAVLLLDSPDGELSESGTKSTKWLIFDSHKQRWDSLDGQRV